ncbi:MAG: GNAT family N-acetyltransferase [Pseudomonadota bacterium]
MAAAAIIETARLVLRKPEGADAAHVAAFYETDRSRFVGGPCSSDQGWRKAAMFFGHWTIRGYGLFTVVRKDTGAPIGLIGPWYPDGWADHEIGWQIWRPEDEGHGFATEAATAARDWCRATLGWTRIVSYIADGNDGSIAVATRMGAVRDPHAAMPSTGPCNVFLHPQSAAA